MPTRPGWGASALVARHGGVRKSFPVPVVIILKLLITFINIIVFTVSDYFHHYPCYYDVYDYYFSGLRGSKVPGWRVPGGDLTSELLIMGGPDVG